MTEEEMKSEVNQSLQRAIRDGNIESKPRTESGRTRTCYNRACKDYRVERDYDVDCECTRPKIKGAGDTASVYF